MGPGRLLHDPSSGGLCFAGLVGPRGYKKSLKKRCFPGLSAERG